MFEKSYHWRSVIHSDVGYSSTQQRVASGVHFMLSAMTTKVILGIGNVVDDVRDHGISLNFRNGSP